MEVSGKKNLNVVSEKITAATAQEYLNNYMAYCIKQGEDPAKILKSLRIDRSAFEAILSNKRCDYIRMYFGIPTNTSGLTSTIEIEEDITLMIVGVDAKNENVLEDGQIYDNASTCPYVCPTKDFEEI